MKFFRNHLIAMVIMALSEVVAVIVGIIVGLNYGWLPGVITFAIIAVVVGLFGFIYAVANFWRTAKNPAGMLN